MGVERYEFLGTLGTGAFSEVKLARDTHKDGLLVAIKCVGKKHNSSSSHHSNNKPAFKKTRDDRLKVEITVLQKIKHENIVQLWEVFEDEKYHYLVMELVTGGELFDRIVERGSYTERDASDLLRQILCAVDYLHDCGIVHRDLKPENLLYRDESPTSKILLSDFGLACVLDEETIMETACGTPGYVAPEILKLASGTSKNETYGKEVDCWSIGVIAYILLCGYPPFYDQHERELYRQICHAEYEFHSPFWDDVSTAAKDFVSRLLQVDPRKRLTCKEASAHPWIANKRQAPNSVDLSESVKEQISRNFIAKKQWAKVKHLTLMTHHRRRSPDHNRLANKDAL